MLVRQYWIKMFNETTVAAVCTTKIIAPRFQAERKHVLEQSTLDFTTVKQVLCVLPEISDFSSVSRTQPPKSTQVLWAAVEGLLRDLVGWRGGKCTVQLRQTGC
jgi:hypothetical protein